MVRSNAKHRVSNHRGLCSILRDAPIAAKYTQAAPAMRALLRMRTVETLMVRSDAFASRLEPLAAPLVGLGEDQRPEHLILRLRRIGRGDAHLGDVGVEHVGAVRR